MWEGKGVYRVSVGKPKGNKPLGRPIRRRKINFKVIFRNWDMGGVD
jgi:hypothetical protein